jgi:cobalt/nickel transport system permease protein
MSDVLVAHPAVFGATLALGGAAAVVAARRAQRGLDEARLPLLGVMGAFVFAGQMVNVSLPGLFTSGHLGGAALLTALFGPSAAIVVMAAVLVVQCLLFQDGGLLALGANLLNLGVVPALVTAGAIGLVRRSARGFTGLLLGAGLGAWLGAIAGAALVPLAALASGAVPRALPAPAFVALLVGLHALIGIGEAVLTMGALTALRRLRPELVAPGPAPGAAGAPSAAVGPAGAGVASRPPRPSGRLVTGGLALSLFIGGGLGHLASAWPDGLERALEVAEVTAPALPAVAQAEQLVAATALFADYEAFPGLAAGIVAATLAGIAGTLVVFALLWGVAVSFGRRARRLAGRAGLP